MKMECPFCGDKMKFTKSVINKDNYDAVKHVNRNNNCPCGVGIYKLDIWNTRNSQKSEEAKIDIAQQRLSGSADKSACLEIEKRWNEFVKENKDKNLDNKQLTHDAIVLLKECLEYVKDDTTQRGMGLYNKINAVLAQQHHA